MKTVRVRIAVAVSMRGEWAARGFDGQNDDNKHSNAASYFSPCDGAHVVFVEADVPIPEPSPAPTVPGEVAP